MTTGTIAYTTAVKHICDRLSNRSAVLFLGAGVNYGIKNPQGEPFPLGQGLSDLISEKLLDSPGFSSNLDEVAEIAKQRCGDKAVNKFIHDHFESFEPSTAHYALVQLPWDVIYTTNYDKLVEKAAGSTAIVPAGRICPVSSTKADLENFSESDILYYKLHGCIDSPNTDEGRLILTKEDYRFYEKHRKRLFARLSRDFGKKTFVFIGYSLVDNNLRALLEDCRNELGVAGFPLSYAIRPGFKDIEESFWKDKFNIQLIRSGGSEFLEELKQSWQTERRVVIPFEERRERVFVTTDNATQFEKVAESFYRLEPASCGGKSDPKQFFSGAEPSWADIRDSVAPPRELYYSILDALLTELTEPNLPSTAYLITGAAGMGKTTLIKTIGFEIAKESHAPVLIHIPGTPLDANYLDQYIAANDKKRLVVIIHHAAECVKQLGNFLTELKKRALPITVLLEERKNQWLMARSAADAKLLTAEFELACLTDVEIHKILSALNKYGCLGKLAGMERSYQEEHFTTLAQKELLVALRELTSGGNFDDIIRNEYDGILNTTAKKAYTYVAALGQIGLAMRYETLLYVLGLEWSQLASEIFTPTAGILISGEEIGMSRHNADFRLRVRHPIIGSIIFDVGAPDDHTKFELLNKLLERLDPGRFEDREVLNAIVTGEALIGTLSSPEFKRALFDRLADVLPDDPFVLQHRSILERRMEKPEAALKYARESARLNPNNPAIQNTLGLALELAAKKAPATDLLLKRGYINEATKIFKEGIRRFPADPYNYSGLAHVMKQEVEAEQEQAKRDLLQTSIISMLEEALEATDNDPVIVTLAGNHWSLLGSSDEAIQRLYRTIQTEPTENRARDLLIRLLEKQNRLQESHELAVAGAKIDPTQWRFQRHIARLGRKLGALKDTIKGHYEAAIRHNKGDIWLLVEYGAYLFQSDELTAANRIFEESRSLFYKQTINKTPTFWWEESAGKKKVFKGKVLSMSGASATAISIPENYKVPFWKTYAEAGNISLGMPITFQIGFNHNGPFGRILVSAPIATVLRS